jgi:predicted anti-sigma-YlaC factor YlaD
MTQENAGPRNCTEPDLADLFVFYINGNVTEQQQEAIENHLAVCPKCRDELQLILDLQTVAQEQRETNKSSQ